jgi:hypothetical protein
MTVGVQLSRLGRNRGRNLYAQYGAPEPYLTPTQKIAAGQTGKGGQIGYQGARVGAALVGAFFGVNGASILDTTFQSGFLDITPLGALFGALFGVKSNQKVYGDRYTEFQLFDSKYGIPLTEGDGHIRVAGNVIWCTQPKEVILNMEQKVGDAPDTFMEYRSRSGATKDELITIGAQYDNVTWGQYLKYKEYHYVISLAISFANVKSVPCEIVRIWADKVIIWDVRDINLSAPTQLMYVGFRNSDFHEHYKDTCIATYNGFQTNRDPTILAIEGDFTPLYKNICYAVIKNLDLNDFGGKIPVIEAEIAFRGETVKYDELLDSTDDNFRVSDVGWVHNTTDGYILSGRDGQPYYYDIDIYDCFAYRSPKIYNKSGQPLNLVGGGAGIHEMKYGYIYTYFFVSHGDYLGDIVFGGGSAYIDRRKNKISMIKDLYGFSPNPTPEAAVYSYNDVMGSSSTKAEVTGLLESQRKVIYAYGLFGDALAASWVFDKGFEAKGWIVPDNDPSAHENIVQTIGYNNQAGGLNSTGEIGGLIIDRLGSYRMTSGSGVFGTNGSPAKLWNTEFLGREVAGLSYSPLYSRETYLSEPDSGAGAGWVALLEDYGTLPGTDERDNGGLLVMNIGTNIIHFNTHIDTDFIYTGVTKSVEISPNISKFTVDQMPMMGTLATSELFSGGLYRQFNCIDLEYVGPNWLLAPVYHNPNGRSIEFPSPTSIIFDWIPVMHMSYHAHALFATYLPTMTKHRYSEPNVLLSEVVKEIILPKVPYITVEDLDVSSLTDLVRGYMMADQNRTREFIERLRKVFFFDVTESDGKLKFIKRGTVDTPLVIGEQLLEDPPKTMVQSVHELAREGSLNFSDINFDYLQGEQRHRLETTKAINLLENAIPVVFNSKEGKAVAKKYVYGSHAESIEVQTTLPRKYSYLDCGDIISFDIYNRLRIHDMAFLQDGGIQIQAVTETKKVYDTESTLDAPIFNSNSTGAMSSARISAIVFEVPYTNTNADNTIGYVYVIPYKRFSSSTISATASVNSTTYRYIGSTNPSKFIGKIGNRLLPPNYSVKHGAWDYDNYIDMFIHHGNAPVSRTKADIYNGNNRIIVGKEIISFTTVTPYYSDGSKYRLTGLLRGREGTEIFVRSHNPGEMIAELYDDMPKIPISYTDIGKLAFIRASDGTNTSLIDAHTVTGTSFYPLAPANIQGEYSGNDIVFTWNRRNSAIGGLLSETDIPQGNITSYSVDILNNDGTVKRTITSVAESATYTEAQQIADFGAVLEDVSVLVYQHTSVYRGYGTFRNIKLVQSIYYNNFSSDTIGVQPSYISIIEGNNIVATVEVNYLGNKVLQLETLSEPPVAIRSYIEITNVGKISDVDIRLKFRYDTFYGYSGQLNGPREFLIIYLSSTDKYISFKDSGELTFSTTGILDGVSSTDTEIFTYDAFLKNVDYNVRIQSYEEVIRIKIWNHIEPSTWLYTYFPEVIASQPMFSLNIAGNFGLGTYSYATKVQITEIEVNDLY